MLFTRTALGPRAACTASMQRRAPTQPSAHASAGPPGQTGRQPSAYVYVGPGAGFRSAMSAMQSLREVLVGAVQVERLTPEQLLSSCWQEDCLVLVMPGGADLPYCRLLNGRGNRLIREYVEGGGAYLGLCAGAYYACARVEFEPGTRLEVVGDRELAFFPGVARGSIYKGFEYESERGAAAARLQYLDLLGSASTAGAAAAPAAAAAGAWERGAAATAAGESRQPGSAAVLAAVPSPSGCDPPEAVSSGGQPAGGRGQQTWRQVEDYINGGPGFFPQDDDGTLLGSPPPGVQVLATYPERGGAAAALLCTLGQGRAVLCGTHPELHPSWLEPCLASADVGACSDRTARSGSATSSSSNGGRSSNGSRSSSGAGPSSGTAQPTLEAAGPSSSVAMLQEAQPWQSSGGSGSPSGDSSSGDSSARRQDGSGHAAAAAAPPGESGSNGGGSNSDQGQPEVSTREEAAPLEHLQELHARLLANQEERWRYWRGLLVAAGLAAWLRPTEPARGAGDPGS